MFWSPLYSLWSIIRQSELIGRVANIPSIIWAMLFILWGIAVFVGGYNLGAVSTGGYISFVMSFVTPVIIMALLNKCPVLAIKMGGVGKHTLSILCAHSIFHYTTYIYGLYWNYSFFGTILNVVFEFATELSARLLGAWLLQTFPLTSIIFKNK